MHTQNNSQLAQPRKLMLKRETLRVLTQDELLRVAGGLRPSRPAKTDTVTSEGVTKCCW